MTVDADGFVYYLAQTLTATEWSVYRTQSADSTSDGWELIASNVFQSTTAPISAPGKMRLFIMPSGDWALIEITDIGATLAVTQWASADKGSSFSLVATDTTSFVYMGDAVLTPSGNVGIMLGIAGDTVWYSTATAFASIFMSSAVTVSTATPVGESWIAVDPSGTMWAWIQTTSIDRILLHMSSDYGATWTQIIDGASAQWLTTHQADVGQYISGGRGVFAMGDAYLFHQSNDAASTYDPSPILTRCGGWSNVQPRSGSGGGPGGVNAGTWLPISEPGDVTVWTPDAANNTARDTFTSEGRLQIITAATTQWWSAANPPTVAAAASAWAGAQIRVESGGSVAAFHCGVAVRVSDGTGGAAACSELQVWANMTSFVVRSTVATLATITVSMEADMQFLIYVERAAHGAVYYKRPYETTWTLAYSSSALGTAAGAVGWIRWGYNTATTTTSLWSYFWYAATTTSSYRPRSRLVTSADQIVLRGKPLTALAAPLGVGSQGTSNQRLLHVRAKDGPAVLGETWTITPRYGFPVSSIFPTESPSPRAVWRSTSTAENSIAFELDPTYTTSLTRSIHLTMLNVNFPTAYIEAHNGATWDTVGTWSGIIGSGLTYTRSGNVIRINGGASLARYIWRGELVGATVDLGGGFYRKIARHTEGIWSSASGKHVELVLEDVTGAEPASGAALAIWSTRGSLVIHGLSTLYRRWRLRIPSGTTATGYYQIGMFACGPIAAFGQQYAWGWTDVTEPNASRTESADKVSRMRRRGPTRRTWTWAWTQLISQRRLRASTPTPDYLGVAASSEGMANQQDVPWLLAGLLEECRSGETPIVAFKAISSTSGTMTTDPTMFLYGRLESSIGFENEFGDESAGEVGRVSPIALVEIP